MPKMKMKSGKSEVKMMPKAANMIKAIGGGKMMMKKGEGMKMKKMASKGKRGY